MAFARIGEAAQQLFLHLVAISSQAPFASRPWFVSSAKTLGGNAEPPTARQAREGFASAPVCRQVRQYGFRIL
jgi:hypothetical protein